MRLPSLAPPEVEFVVAVAENDVIGRDNSLPWRLPADLRRFKATTMGHSMFGLPQSASHDSWRG